MERRAFRTSGFLLLGVLLLIGAFRHWRTRHDR